MLTDLRSLPETSKYIWFVSSLYSPFPLSAMNEPSVRMSRNTIEFPWHSKFVSRVEIFPREAILSFEKKLNVPPAMIFPSVVSVGTLQRSMS